MSFILILLKFVNLFIYIIYTNRPLLEIYITMSDETYGPTCLLLYDGRDDGHFSSGC